MTRSTTLALIHNTLLRYQEELRDMSEVEYHRHAIDYYETMTKELLALCEEADPFEY